MAGNREEGIDLAQEAFARALERWDRYDSPEHARNSVVRIGVNLARSHARRRSRMSDRALESVPEQAAPESDVIERIVVLDALRQLSHRQRTCIVLTDYLGMDSTAISRSLRIPAGSVRTHLARGRKKLRTLLRDQEVIEP